MPVRSLSILCTAMSTAAYYILCRTTRRSASCDSTTCSGSQTKPRLRTEQLWIYNNKTKGIPTRV
ncbi:hypothetical protein PF008_g7107 [Phytophthora fragariae]|uniref:Uncharacterized protein n=1 Tax=Phytophthora fragariae TaxID=53985 RepID=A0A6G0S417_9STRA|nr:hypothetical protein PF008_g7107 [Phytophthora fragariae]